MNITYYILTIEEITAIAPKDYRNVYREFDTLNSAIAYCKSENFYNQMQYHTNYYVVDSHAQIQEAFYRDIIDGNQEYFYCCNYQDLPTILTPSKTLMFVHDESKILPRERKSVIR